MSISRASLKGLTFYDSMRAYNGVTLFTPKLGKGAWLIDMLGRFVNYWEVGYEPGCDAQLLPNGNLLYMGKVSDGFLAGLEGAGGIILELDWNGKLIWQYEDPYLHHTFYRMRNGNTLVLKWVKIPVDIAAKVKGGDAGTERDGIMWGDAIQEITADGKVTWEWIGHEHIRPEVPRCPICPRDTWTHANAIIELSDGNIITSFMKMDTIAIIDKKTGDIKWQWGTSELAHQYCPTILDSGNILVFDNGFHAYGFPSGFSRVLEIDLKANRMVWAYEGGEIGTKLYSSSMGNCQRLPNGNTLICEGTTGRIFEVTPSSELVWEFVNNLPSYEPYPAQARSYMVCSAYRYGMDYSGLKGSASPIKRQLTPSTEVKKEQNIKARLKRLAY